MLVSALCIPVAADEFSSAKLVDSGSKVSFTLKAKEKLDDGRFDGDGEPKIFKIELSKKGTLQLDIISAVSKTTVQVLDEDGAEAFRQNEKKITTGGYSTFGTKEYLSWDKTIKKSKATLKYNLEKGVYYIKVFGASLATVEGKTSITFKYPQAEKSDNSAKITSFSVTIKKGDTLQLGAILSGEGDVTWSTSKKSVATVSKNGKITAKAKGTAVITAKTGDSSMKITINVTA